ncbi:Hypothetical predicted protein [Octopus vulgaris]|uniref:Uncharacterized protein n=1 Tax=Octopus vulgaris TaxID=6645 RepID=A0AA36BXU0_OCTVU|nr:Hypothetical predicted protein [Octopus vulgaris]
MFQFPSTIPTVTTVLLLTLTTILTVTSNQQFYTGSYRSLAPGLCISRLHGHIHPPEAAELTQHMISIDTIDVVNVHPIQLTTTGDPHKSRFTF